MSHVEFATVVAVLVGCVFLVGLGLARAKPGDEGDDGYPVSSDEEIAAHNRRAARLRRVREVCPALAERMEGTYR